MNKFWNRLEIFNYGLACFALYGMYENISVGQFIFCVAWVFNTACKHFVIINNTNEIRGLENRELMLKDRVNELLIGLEKFDK